MLEALELEPVSNKFLFEMFELAPMSSKFLADLLFVFLYFYLVSANFGFCINSVVFGRLFARAYDSPSSKEGLKFSVFLNLRFKACVKGDSRFTNSVYLKKVRSFRDLLFPDIPVDK